MKRLFLLSGIIIMVSSCASFLSNGAPDYTFTVTEPYQDDLVVMVVPGLQVQNRLSTGLQVIGVDLQVQNKSSKSLTIKWGDSSIDFQDKSHVIFLGGRYYSDAGKRMADSIVTAGAKVKDSIYPADYAPAANAAQTGVDYFDPINAKEIICRITIDLGGEGRIYVVKITIGASGKN